MIAILNFYCLAAKFDFSASQIIFQSRRCTEYLHSPPITEKCRISKGLNFSKHLVQKYFVDTLYIYKGYIRKLFIASYKPS